MGRNSLKQPSQIGYTVIEVLVAFFFIGILVALGRPIIQSLFLYQRKIALLEKEAQAYSQFAYYLHKAVEGVDTHRMAFLPKVWKSTIPHYSDGTPIAFTHPPAPTSDAITYFALSPAHEFHVREILSSSPLRVLACEKSDERFSFSGKTPMLALTADGPREVVASYLSSSGNCVKIGLQSEGSASFPPQPLVLGGVLIPLLYHQTLYLDTKHTLRVISLIGRNIIENQPIGEGVKSILIESQPHPVYAVKGSIEIEGFLPRTELASAHLSRLSYPTVLFSYFPL